MENNYEQNKNQQGIQSVEVGIRLLKALANNGRAMKLRDLALGVDMPPSKVHRYLVSLIRTGLVEQQAESGLYDLGPYALQFSLDCLNRLDPVRVASAALTELCIQIDETVLLAVWGNHGPTIIRWEESRRPVTVNVRIGSVMPLLKSATGRVFATYLPREFSKALLETELQDLGSTGDGLKDPDEVERLLAEVRAKGLARVSGDLLAGVSALSAPVFDHQGRIVLAITALGQAGSFDADWDGRIAAALKTTASALSQRMGYR